MTSNVVDVAPEQVADRNVVALVHDCRRKIDRIERFGGPLPEDRPDYRDAVATVEAAEAELEGELGFWPFIVAGLVIAGSALGLYHAHNVLTQSESKITDAVGGAADAAATGAKVLVGGLVVWGLWGLFGGPIGATFKRKRKPAKRRKAA